MFTDLITTLVKLIRGAVQVFEVTIELLCGE
jgi:hypothetical protein